MKFRWWDKAALLVPPLACGRKQRREVEFRTKCFTLKPVNSQLKGKKSQAEVQLAKSEAVEADKMLYWQVILRQLWIPINIQSECSSCFFIAE